METINSAISIRLPWNKGKLVGQKAPFKLTVGGGANPKLPSGLQSFAKRVIGHVSVGICPSPMFDRPSSKWSIALTRMEDQWSAPADGEDRWERETH
jgi:hypothetical protein